MVAALTLRDAPLINPVEYVLGYLWRGPATWEEIVSRADSVGSPLLELRQVEAAIRRMKVQGLIIEEDGRLILRRDRLHPLARRVAAVIARDLEKIGVR